MIDFIRIHYDYAQELEEFVLHPDNFKEVEQVLEYHSKEVRYPYKANFKNFQVVVNVSSGYIKNSLHKYFDLLQGGNGENHSDFSFSNVIKMIESLEERFVGLHHAKLTQLEFGLNIQLDMPARPIVKENILMHKYNSPTIDTDFEGTGQYKQFNYRQYYIKTYDKALMYKVYQKNILRFEVKFISRKVFNKLGIMFLSDLKVKGNIIRLFNYLLNKFDEMIIVDGFTENDNIPEADLKQIEIYKSSIYWQSLNDRNKRNRRIKSKKDFRRLLEKYNLLKIKAYIRELLIQKFEELIST